MITPVTDEDLERLSTAEDRDACTGGTQDRIDAVIAELRALRKVADEAERLCVAWNDDRSPSANLMLVLRALRDAGRLG